MIYSIIKEYLCHFQYLATFNSSVTVLYLYLVNFGTYFYSVYSEEHNRWVKNLVYSVLLESAKKVYPNAYANILPKTTYESLSCSA